HVVGPYRHLKGFLDLGVKVVTPVSIYCDNRSAIHIAENPVFHEHTKHIEIYCHVTRERIKLGLIKLHHVSTEGQLADLFTKGFHR
ncbi:Retrovirus-related Pol polyprotein from transposon RE1, partial [Linum perenne]